MCRRIEREILPHTVAVISTGFTVIYRYTVLIAISIFAIILRFSVNIELTVKGFLPQSASQIVMNIVIVIKICRYHVHVVSLGLTFRLCSGGNGNEES